MEDDPVEVEFLTPVAGEAASDVADDPIDTRTHPVMCRQTMPGPRLRADYRSASITIIDVADPDAQPTTFDAGAKVHDLAWAAPDKLAVATSDQLIAVDVPRKFDRQVARLISSDRWSLASAADTC